jgi:glycerol uptake facilitator-like aquaporin
MPVTFGRRLVAEFLGTMLLLAIVVGSGIMADRLSGGSAALALLGNAMATGAGLVVLIHIFGPLSGAHFNPVVTLAVWLKGEASGREASLYGVAQLCGSIMGVWLAHAMFALEVIQLSAKARDGVGQSLSEAIATFGLLATVLVTQRHRPEFTPIAVGLYITSAYWFTASTSFANPAVTVARSLTSSFAGIAPHSVIPFLLGQLVGALIAIRLFDWLLREQATT